MSFYYDGIPVGLERQLIPRGAPGTSTGSAFWIPAKEVGTEFGSHRYQNVLPRVFNRKFFVVNRNMVKRQEKRNSGNLVVLSNSKARAHNLHHFLDDVFCI